MALIEVSSGAPEIADGTYYVTVTAIDGPRHTTFADGSEADMLDWEFAVDDGQAYAGTVIRDSCNQKSTGAKSKMRGWLIALFGGRVPPDGTQLNASDIVGRNAIATIEHNDKDWPKIVNLSAVPQRVAPTVTLAAPAAPVAVAPAAPPVELAADGLPALPF
jgi:hypothetical protein